MKILSLRRAHLRRWGALSLALALCLLAPPLRAEAAGVEFGLQDDAQFIYQGEQPFARSYQLLEQLSMRRLRVNLIWNRVAPSPQQSELPGEISYDFSQYDPGINQALSRGVKVQLSLMGGAPAWASGDGRISNYLPDPVLYREFARQAALHFQGRVTRFSVWNEPNWPSQLAPQAGGRAARHYRRLFQEGSAGFRQGNPDAQVLIGETSPQGKLTSKGPALAPLAFLRIITCSNREFTRVKCARLQAEGYAHHPYGLEHSPLHRSPKRDDVSLSAIPRLRSALSRLAKAGGLSTAGGRPLGVYGTEYGYLTAGSRRVSEARQKRYLVQSVSLAKRVGLRQLIYYHLRDAPGSSGWHSGLQRPSGHARPALKALGHAVRRAG